jgi:hypothetical protein
MLILFSVALFCFGLTLFGLGIAIWLIGLGHPHSHPGVSACVADRVGGRHRL